MKAQQALLWMVNQADYVRAVAGDPKFWRTCAAYLMCGTPLETDAGAQALTQNLGKARQVMKEAGYDGRPIVLLEPTDLPYTHNTTLVTAQLLRKIGVQVQATTPVPQATSSTRSPGWRASPANPL